MSKNLETIFPVSLRWILLKLILLLIFSACGLLWFKNSTKSLQTSSLPKNSCFSFFQEGSILRWRIKNYGRIGNIGTLEIRKVNLLTGQWVGDQVTETKNNFKTRMTGKINGSTMSLLHSSGAERWFGICENGKIEGSIETTYDSQLTFEIR